MNLSIPQFKIRCSAIGHIMTEAKGSITQKQLEEIEQLEAKEKRTDRQSERLIELINKRDNPQLSATAKSYCEDWLKSQIYERRLEFTSKYTEKGLVMEDAAIDFVAEYLNLGILFKNDERYSNDFMIGETDVNFADYVFDVKNSWSWETFPLLDQEIPNMNYYWQLQGYMELTGKHKAKLIYCLSDTPQYLIEREARSYCFNNGYDSLDMDIYNDFHKKLTYPDVPNELKIQIFEFDYCEEDIKRIADRVEQCRTYIKKLTDNLLNKLK